MRKSSRSQRYRVSTRDAAAYRAAPEQDGVFQIAAAMQTFADHFTMLEASQQADEMEGAAAAHHIGGVLLGATPATTPIEEELKVAILGPFVTSDGAGMSADAAMVAEAIRYERQRWNLCVQNPLPN